MKATKRILSVKIKRMIDDSPDTSSLGKYSNKTETEYAIDRKHSLECPVNTGKEGLLWYTSGSGRIEFRMTLEQAESVSHSGECDSDVYELSRVPEIKAQLDKLDPAILSAELKEYGAWDTEELSDHVQNLQRILWLAGGDIRDNDGCDCGEHGDMGRNEFRYFNACVENYEGETPEDTRKYVRQDYERMESLNAGHWCFIGIQAEARIEKVNVRAFQITSGGLWGIESDSDKSDLESVEKDELSDLREQLKALGFSSRAISTAFKNVERKDR